MVNESQSATASKFQLPTITRGTKRANWEVIEIQNNGVLVDSSFWKNVKRSIVSFTEAEQLFLGK